MRSRRCKSRRQQRVSAIELLEPRCLLTGPGDFVGDTLATATNLGSLAPGGFLFQFGTIDVAGDVDVFQFQTATPGLAFVQLSADRSLLDTVVTLRDAFGNVVAANDDFNPGVSTDSFLTFLVEGGRAYFVEASGFGISTGDFFLGLSLDVLGAAPADTLDFGPLVAEVPVQHFDSLDFAGDFDVFQFQADSSGVATFQLNANGGVLDTVVTLLDSAGNFLASNDDFNVAISRNSLLTRTVQAGETYYIVASGFGSSVGDYVLGASLDAGDTIATARNLGLLPTEELLQFSGTIGVTGDRDLFQFQADTPGLTVIQLNATNSSSLDPFLTLFDASGNPVRSDDDSGPGRNSLLTYTIVGGQPYYIGASGFGPTFGEYAVSISLPNVTELGVLSATQSFRRSRTIEVPEAREFFQFQPDASGLVTIQLDAANASLLDPFVTLLDSTGAVLQLDDDSGDGSNSLLEFSIVSGQTYYVVASGFGVTTGGYDLSITLEPDSLPSAEPLPLLTRTQRIEQLGQIDRIGNIDFYQFQSDASGLVVIQVDRGVSSSLDPNVALLDSNGATIEEDDDNGRGPHSFLTYSIVSGQTYYIVVSATEDDDVAVSNLTGDYVLSVALPEVPSLGMLSSTQPLQRDDTISAPLQSDFFSFLAQTTGVATVALTAIEPRTLDPVLTVLSPNGAYLTFNDDIQYPFDTNSRLTIDVVQGQTYFLQVEGFESTMGNYSLSVSLPASISLRTLRSTQPIQRDGEITSAGEIDLYQFTTDKAGLLILTMDPTDSQMLDTVVTLRDAAGSVLAVNDDVNFPSQKNSRLTYSIEAGETYMIEARGFGISTGRYQLNASLLTDNVSPIASPQTAFDLGTLSGVSPQIPIPIAIEVSEDRDVFQFRVETPSLVTIGVNADDPSAFDPFLRVLNSAGMTVAFNDDINYPVNFNSQVSFIAQADQTYFIDVSDFIDDRQGFRGDTGIYTLSATAVPAPTPQRLTFPAAGVSTTDNGNIAMAGAISRFRLDPATSDQLVRVEVNAANPTLDPVFDPLVTVRVLSESGENGMVLNTFLDDDSGPGRNSLLSLAVASGQVLEIDVSGFGTSTGAFSLAVTAQAAANTPIPLDRNSTSPNFVLTTNNIIRSGTISERFERDAYRFTAATSGQINIDLVTTDGSLDPLLTVSTVSNGAEIRRNDDSPFNLGLLGISEISQARIPITSLNSHLEFNVTAGVTYDIVAQDYSSRTGSYFLVATTTDRADDFVDSFENLDTLRREAPDRAIDLNGRHEFGLSSPVRGTISAAVANQSAQDVDLLDFQANFTGVLNLSLTLDPNLTVSVFHDMRLSGAASGDYELIDVLSQDDERPMNSTLSIPVDENGIYVVRIAGATGSGSYQLSGRDANVNQIDQVPDSIADAGNRDPLEFNVPTTSAINFRFDRDVYRFVAPSSGLISVSLREVNGSDLDTLLVVYNDKGMPIASNDDLNFAAGRTDSRVTFAATAGAVYYAEASGIGPSARENERDFATGEYRLLVTLPNGDSNSAPATSSASAERSLLEAVTTGLVSIANGAGMMGDRNPDAIRNAVVEAIATLAKQGKLSSDYLVLILDASPESGFVFTNQQGMATTVGPGTGVTSLPMGGIVNYGPFAGVALLPMSGGGVPTLQVSGYGSNLGSSFQAATVSRTGSSQLLTSQERGRTGTSTDGKVQLTFALGFEAPQPIPGTDSTAKSGQAPSFFGLARTSNKAAAADQDKKDDDETAVALAETETDAVEVVPGLPPPFDPLDPEAWLKMFESVLESLQFEGLSRPMLDTVLAHGRVDDNSPAVETLKRTPVVRSAKVVYEVLKQGASWMNSGPRKAPTPPLKPRTPKPKVTQETSPPKYLPQERNGSTKVSQLGG
ncbi:MAG: hypothetical protein ACKV2Q_10195 [Planctomycetaceae bacterium]